jgi:hypothetical protein
MLQMPLEGAHEAVLSKMKEEEKKKDGSNTLNVVEEDSDRSDGNMSVCLIEI